MRSVTQLTRDRLARWRRATLRQRVRAIVVALSALVALAMLAYRYANFGSVPFINDEPAFLAAAREQLGAGHWVAVSPLVGKQNLHYGPTVLWFYGAVHWAFGPNPAIHILVMLTCITASQIALGYGLGKAFGWTAGAAALALVAASPYQFFWARLAWDQCVDIASALVAFAFALNGRITTRRAAFLGVTLGLAVSSHLMVLPLTMIAFGFLAFEGIRDRAWAPFASAAAAAAIVNVPYLLYMAHHYREMTPAGPVSWDLVQTYALEPARVATLVGIDYFFDNTWANFLTAVPRWQHALLLQPNVEILLGVLAALGLARAAWVGRGGQRRIALLGIATWVGYAIFFGQRNVGTPPHYQFATWWVIPTGIAAGLSAARTWSPGARWLAFVAVWAFSLGQMRFIGDWMTYVRAHGGTPVDHYGTPLREQVVAVDAMCATDRPRVFVSNETKVFDLSLRYVASVEAKCAGKTVAFCDVDACPKDVEAHRVRLAYARPGAGWLFVHPND